MKFREIFGKRENNNEAVNKPGSQNQEVKPFDQEQKVVDLTNKLDAKQQMFEDDVQKYGGQDKFKKALYSNPFLRAKYGGDIDLMDIIGFGVRTGVKSIYSFIKKRIESRKLKNQKTA